MPGSSSSPSRRGPCGCTSALCSSLFWRSVMVEIFGTFLLLTVQCSLPLGWKTDHMGKVVQIALGMGIVVMVLVEMFSPIGDAHFNPAVTIAMFCARKVSIGRAVIYIVAQCAGAILGAFFTYFITPSGYHDTLAVTALHPEVSPWKGAIIEAWLTMMLVLTIFGCTSDHHTPRLGPPALPIGFAVSMDILAGIQYTGASLNPARSLGPALVMNLWDHQWVYWLGPIIGGMIACIVYHYLFINDWMFPPPSSNRHNRAREMDSLDTRPSGSDYNNNSTANNGKVTFPDNYWPVKTREEADRLSAV